MKFYLFYYSVWFVLNLFTDTRQVNILSRKICIYRSRLKQYRYTNFIETVCFATFLFTHV